MKHIALTVESRPGNFLVLSRFLRKMNIDALHVQKLCDIDRSLSSLPPASVAIIDLSGYDDSIWDCCKSLRRSGVPMLIISSSGNPESLKTGYEHGARSVLKKPVIMKELADCIRSLIISEE